MRQNPFLNMLDSEVFTKDLSTAKLFRKENPNYFPKPATINKLLSDNFEIINFINNVNPYADSFVYSDRDYQKIVKDIRAVLPLAKSTTDKLSEAAIEEVLVVWREGIIKNIQAYSNDIKGKEKYGLTIEDLLFTFVEPLINVTRTVINNKHILIQNVLKDVCLNSAYVSSILRMDVQNILKNHYFYLVSHKEYTETDIESYKKLKHKPLNVLLDDTLNSKDYRAFSDVMRHIDGILDFVDIPVVEILRSAENRLNQDMVLLEKLQLQLIEVKKLKKNPDYKIYSVKQKTDRKIHIVKSDYEDLKRCTILSLKSLSLLWNQKYI